MKERKADPAGVEVRRFDDILMAVYARSDVSCTVPVDTHILVYVYGGELEICEEGTARAGAEPTLCSLHRGDCAFIRRDISVRLTKRGYYGVPFKAAFLRFMPHFLRGCHTRLQRSGQLPHSVRRPGASVYPIQRSPAVHAIFSQLEVYFSGDAGEPSPAFLSRTMEQGLQLILDADPSVCAGLFDFVKPWKIDIMEFLEEHFEREMTLEEMARYTGRSLSAFKRDFAVLSTVPPQKWLIERRLRAAHTILTEGAVARVSEACHAAGFKNISHFSRAFRARYGVTPASVLRHAAKSDLRKQV